jgi:site-specific DNA recombinase
MARRRAERQQAEPEPEPLRTVRCAVYTRKSTDEGLDQEFNSLDAQREACASYIKSQSAHGWALLAKEYSDGGYSGATTDRPGFQRLLADLEAGEVDAVVVYKIDRLSRSLRDFVRLMDLFERRGVSFVSVTQRFDTSSSMGKLTLNILMSFAEFERDVTRERILDKIGAAKKKGKHCGGMPILGYDTDRAAKRLVVNPGEAKLVRLIFTRFTELRSTSRLAKDLNAAGHRTKSWKTVKGLVRGGGVWNKAQLYQLLNNPKYIGQVEHRGTLYPGEHEAIVSQKLWDEVHAILEANHTARANQTRSRTEALLRGIIRCVHCDAAMGPTFSRKNGRTYRYYLCTRAGKHGYDACPVRAVSAGTIEDAVLGQLRAVFRTPEVVTRTFREAKARVAEETERLQHEKAELETRLRELADTLDRLVAVKSPTRSMAQEIGRAASAIDGTRDRLDAVTRDLETLEADTLTEADVVEALGELDGLWSELFPAERARIVGLLISRVDVRPDALELRLRAEGLRSLVTEVGARNGAEGGQ